jgi:hypothetical protein
MVTRKVTIGPCLGIFTAEWVLSVFVIKIKIRVFVYNIIITIEVKEGTCEPIKVRVEFSTFDEVVLRAVQHFGGSEQGNEQEHWHVLNIEIPHPLMKCKFLNEKPKQKDQQ